MSNPLIQALSTWRGREAVQRAIEDKGFLVHRRWQERIASCCGAEHADELTRYWDECAAEFVRCAGKVHSDARWFGVEPAYRSSYLDELAANGDFATASYRYPPLLKCVYEYINKLKSDRGFLDSETSYFESLKVQEIARLSITSEGLQGQKRDVIPFVQKFGMARGFRQKRNRLVKQSPADLVFEIKIDLGWNPLLGAGLPLKFNIYHRANPDFVFEATLFDAIVSGFGRYEYCPTPDSCVLGILAHVEFFDVLFGSFGGDGARAEQ